MRLANQNIENYGISMYVFFYWLKTNVPKNQKVWKAFLKWSTLDEKTALDCLSLGTSPILKINENLFGDPYSNGHFKPSEPDFINVAGRFAQNARGSGKIEDLKALEALILHELCHWGRCRTNTEDGYYENGADSGDMFKREAYSNPNKPHLG